LARCFILALQEGRRGGDTRAFCKKCENKEVAENGICKWLKIKKIEIDVGALGGRGIRKIVKTAARLLRAGKTAALQKLEGVAQGELD
jgi:hypothetical protein